MNNVCQFENIKSDKVIFSNISMCIKKIKLISLPYHLFYASAFSMHGNQMYLLLSVLVDVYTKIAVFSVNKKVIELIYNV